MKDHVACWVSGYKTAGNEAGLASALSNAGPVGVAIDCMQPGFRNYRSGVYDDPGCSKTDLNHAVTAIGYDSNAWIVRNRYLHFWAPIAITPYNESHYCIKVINHVFNSTLITTKRINPNHQSQNINTKNTNNPHIYSNIDLNIYPSDQEDNDSPVLS